MIPFNEAVGVVLGESKRKGGEYPALVQSTTVNCIVSVDSLRWELPALVQSTTVNCIVSVDSLRWELPAWGEQKEDCGKFLKAISCPDHHKPVVLGKKHDRGIILKHCYNPECPVCYESWAIREGNKAAERVQQAKILYQAAGADLWDVKHITLSPLQDEAKELIKTASGYKKLKSSAIKMMKKAGLKGGVIVFHPFRQNKKNKGWYLSPHFHVVGYGFLINSDEFYQKTGWVYKSMGKRTTVAGTIIYTLTHCGLAYNSSGIRVFHALTWFGLLSYNKIVKESEIKDDVDVPCTCCRASLHEYELEVTDDGYGLVPNWNRDKGVYFVKRKRIKYKLADKKPSKAELKELEYNINERIRAALNT